jgi:hypothetical protein
MSAATVKDTAQISRYAQKNGISNLPAHPKSSNPISAQNPSDCEIQKSLDEENQLFAGMPRDVLRELTAPPSAASRS